jgi:hypothetical protein
MTSGHLSPHAAAKKAGVGRTTIMRALEKGDIPLSHKDNNGRWKISPQGLDDWMKMRPVTARKSPDMTTVSDGYQPDTDPGHTMVRIDEHMRMMADLAASNARIEELKSGIERDEKRHLSEIERLEKIIENLTRPRPTLLERISGAFRNSTSGV